MLRCRHQASTVQLETSCELFNVRECVDNQILPMNQDAKNKADLLVKYLRSRLNAFMSKRNVTKAKQNHWAMQLAKENRSAVAEFMVISQHNIKNNLQPLDETTQ